MSSSRVESSDIACPFWRGWHKDTVIRCEGFLDGTELRFAFPSREARVNYEKAFCNRQYRRCPICKACMEIKYQEED